MMRLLCGVLATGLVCLFATGASADDAAKAIIAKAIQAHGGAENLAKLRVRQEKTIMTTESEGQVVTVVGDTLVDLPDRWKEVKEFERQGRKSIRQSAANGDKSWSNFGLGVKEFTGINSLTRIRNKYYAFCLTPLLKDERFALSLLADERVNDRPALGVKVSIQDDVGNELYFDKETGLLVKSRRRIPSQTGELNFEIYYSNYKETDGVKWPRKCVFFHNGNKSGEEEITDLKFLDKIDEREFDKP